MYQIGEKIIYGNNGVCIVEAIQMIEDPYSYEEKPYYVLRPVFQDCKISVPVGIKAIIRPVLTYEEALALIDRMPQMDVKPYYNSVLRQLQDYYEKKISSYSSEALMELTMSLQLKKKEMLAQKRKFGAIDERYMKRAEDLLFGELSVALDIPKNEVRGFIAARLEGA